MCHNMYTNWVSLDVLGCNLHVIVLFVYFLYPAGARHLSKGSKELHVFYAF